MTGSSEEKVVSEFNRQLFWLCGASSGIGFAVAQELAKKGANLILMSRSPERLSEAKKQLENTGAHTVEIAPFDLTDSHTPARAAAFLNGRPLRGLLLNGGGPHGGKATTLNWQHYENAHNLLLAGPANLLASLVPALEKKVGSVVAVTSTTVRQPHGDLPLSAAYRTGLVALLKHFADELGPSGVRVNNVAPGYTATDRLDDLKRYVAKARFGADSESAMQTVEKEWAATAPLNRVAAASEIAKACVFLFSTDASFITGQTLVVDGGQMRSY